MHGYELGWDFLPKIDVFIIVHLLSCISFMHSHADGLNTVAWAAVGQIH